jgi:type I restriction enzyme S subunit
VKISDMLQGEIVSTEERISRAGLDNSAAKLLPKGTLLLSIFATIGRTALLTIPATTNQAIVGLGIRDNARLDRDFLRRFLELKSVELEAKSRGVAQSNINGAILKSVTVPLPPLAEQRRIAEVLHKAEALRAKRRAALAQLETLTQSLFLDHFGIPKNNPNQWAVVALMDICSPKQWPTISTSELTSEGYPVFGANGQIGFYSAYNHDEPTVLVTCRGATCGTVNVCKAKSYVTGNAMALDEPDSDRIHIAYLEHVLRVRGLADTISGTAQPQITRQGLHVVKFPLPPLALQNEFARRVGVVEKLKTLQRASLAAMDALFASLQDRAFRGEL